MNLKIVTPEGSAYEGPVDFVSLPGAEGELGIYPHHTPLIVMLKAGAIHARTAANEQAMAIGHGFAEITGEAVTIMTESALKEADIDENAAEEAIRRARAALAHKMSDEEIAATEATLAKSMAQLHIKRRKRGA